VGQARHQPGAQHRVGRLPGQPQPLREVALRRAVAARVVSGKAEHLRGLGGGAEQLAAYRLGMPAAQQRHDLGPEERQQRLADVPTAVVDVQVHQRMGEGPDPLRSRHSPLRARISPWLPGHACPENKNPVISPGVAAGVHPASATGPSARVRHRQAVQ
jgi:hypothetical protein